MEVIFNVSVSTKRLKM